MHTTFAASRVSLRTIGSIPSSFDEYAHCSSEPHPFLDSLSRMCCICNFSGSRQSCLFKWSHCRKLISSGLGWRRYYARLPVCDVSGSCCCDNVCWFEGNGVGCRKGGLRQCRASGEKGEGYDHVDVEAVLSLLAEEFDGFTKEARRLLKESAVGERDDCEASKKREVNLSVREDGSVISSRRAEAIWREDRKNDRQTNITVRDKEERKALFKKKSRKEEGKKEEESKLRKENLKVSLRKEGEFFGREEDKQKVRKQGSIGSSCYSYSTDDYDSNTATEIRKGEFLEGSSGGGREGNSRKSNVLFQEDKEENWSQKDYREVHQVDESDFRKKSEKKLVDLSVQDSELRKEAYEKESKLSMTHDEVKHKKSSDHYASYDDRQAKSSMKFHDERKQQIRQTDDDLSRKSNTRMKYKQFVGMKDSRGDDVIKSYGSQKILSDKHETSTEAASSSQKAVGVSKMDDEYQRNFHKVSRISEIQEIDIEKASSSQQRFVASFKEEGDFTKQQQHFDRASGLIESKEESPEFTQKEGRPILKQISKPTTQQLENLNIASGSSLESKRQPSSNILKGDHYKKESNALAELSFFHSQDSGAIDLETNSEIVHKELQKDRLQHISGYFQPKKHKPRHNDQPPEIKGPSDELWDVDDPSIQEQSRVEVENDPINVGNAIVRGSGRSFWDMISDFVRIHLFARYGSRSLGGKNSSNQSIGSETWFSGHETEEKEGEAGDKEQKVITQGLPCSQLEGEIRSQVEEGSMSSTLEGHLKHVGVSVPSSSKVLEKGSEPIRTSLYSGFSEKSEFPVDKGEPKQKTLQWKDQFIEDRFDEWENAYKVEMEQRRIDEIFMREALLEAQKAADNWEVPVGAALVHGGKIIARGCNLVEEMCDSTAHAEMICIREASNRLQTWRLSETTLYVTLEPCPMCAGAILQARIDTVVWGAPNKLLGADGSWIRLFPKGDEGNGLEQMDKPAAPVHPFHPNIVIRRGVLAPQCADEMQQFFKLRRKIKDPKPDSSAKPSYLPIPDLLAKIHRVINLMFCL